MSQGHNGYTRVFGVVGLMRDRALLLPTVTAMTRAAHVSALWISKQHAQTLKGNGPTPMTIGIIATGELAKIKLSF